MWFQFNPLHWGEVNQLITVVGGDPASGEVAGIMGNADLTEETGEGTTDRIKGSGGVSSRASGSSRNGISGSGGRR